ncbi:MAG: FAD-dependent oxidoreductase, partial [Vicinamibacteria bacterium]|nr:FAD-dependent oxidoreductase [Vicinamibacteria bacterium]
ILATGARAARLGIPGESLAGVFALRNLEDARAIDQAIGTSRRAIVLGGGNVGLQAAEALLARGVHVTVLVGSAHLLSQMADAEIGRRVARRFAEAGAEVRLSARVRAIQGTDRVAGVTLEDGTSLSAACVIVAKGIEPDVAWLKGSGLILGRGVQVDNACRSNLADIYAAGDCAEAQDPHTGRPSVSGIWPLAQEMGRAAGINAAGGEQRIRGALRMNAARFFGVPIITIGDITTERVEAAQSRVLVQSAASYRRLILHAGRLMSAQLYGDVSGAGLLYRLYREGVDLAGFLREDFDERDLAHRFARLTEAPV